MEPQRKKAVELTRRGLSDSEIARQLGVHRSTVMRWQKDQEFQEALAAPAPAGDPGELAANGLAEMVPDALELLHAALSNDTSAAKMNSALSIIRLAIEVGGGNKEVSQGLAARLAELDSQGVQSD